MPLNTRQIVEQARILHDFHTAERAQLDEVRRYWKGRQALPAVIPVSAPNEVKVMARSSRVNVIPIVVNSLVQSTFVDGFRAEGESTNAEVWSAWQANRMDARQSAIHRATFGFGTGYAVVMPGDPEPVIRGVSPRAMTAVYGEDPDWPMWGFEKLGNGLWKLYDDQAVYYVSEKTGRNAIGADELTFEHVETREHGIGVTPVVRYLDEEDLDAEDEVEDQSTAKYDVPTRGQVTPLMPIQDQIDLTTFGLQVAQHYGAFKQRYIIGWVAESEKEMMKHGASYLFAVDTDANEVKVGEWGQNDLKGYIESRESSLRHAATLSQTPVHELLGQLVNLSAEALAAAEAGKDRKVDERKTLTGESHEQTMWLVGQIKGIEVPDDAQVVWRDTSARAFAATVDGLGKLVTMLGIPPQELWERVPGATRQDVQRWKTAAEQGDSFRVLADMLERQAGENGTVPAAA